MIIHKLKASSFKIIGDPINITLPEEGRIGILGQNECGKTTFFQAIEYALYGLKKGSGPESDRDNLVTWGKNEAKLEIEFTSGQNRYSLQRKFSQRSHQAKLTPIINGFFDASSSITGLRDVENQIEQITGMDRDSFTKLVYIKQKDLDALKELAKSKREQLVNKVMGIELFDEASSKVKNDAKDLERELEKDAIRLDNAKRNKESYETKLDQKTRLRDDIREKQDALAERKVKLDEVKAILTKYDWMLDYNSKIDLKSSLKRERDRIEKELNEISELQQSSTKLNDALRKYKPEFDKLQSLRDKLSDVERQLQQCEQTTENLRTQKQTLIEGSGLKTKDLKLISQNLSKLKTRQLTRSGITLAIGLIFLILPFLISLLSMLGIGLAMLAVAAYFFSRYLKLDKLATQNIEIESLNKQIQSAESQKKELKSQKSEAVSETSYETSEEVNTSLEELSNLLNSEFGANSIIGIETLLKKTNSDLDDILADNPEEKKNENETKIEQNNSEIKDLEQKKPDAIDNIQYSRQKHDSLKEQINTLQTEYDGEKEALDTDKGTIKQLEDDLKKLQPDFKTYPELVSKFEAKEYHHKLLKRVNLELAETSKELRNKVIPHARLIINQILPTLTSDRYSDFEITEDLKFKVHSNQAGGYKEREIFSGGTQDQFLIALRLAFTQSILDSRVMADRYSLLMDECTSSSDEIRKQGIFEVLDMMKKTFSQIFIIAHEDIANYVDHHIILERNRHGLTEIKSRSWAK